MTDWKTAGSVVPNDNVPDSWKKIPVSVYHASPLVKVFEFNQLFVVGADIMSENWMRDKLEFYFEQFNVGETEMANVYREQHLRSLSVGDVVVIGETAWLCDVVGWTKITTEEFKERSDGFNR